MLSAKYEAMLLAVMFIALAYSASAQWSSGGEMVYMGDLNLAASSASSITSGKAVQALGGSQAILEATNNSSMNNSSLNNSSINATTIDAPVSSGKNVLDLSGYSRDRANKNLAGYKNIMYPISESRGSTTSTTSGGGCGCG